MTILATPSLHKKRKSTVVFYGDWFYLELETKSKNSLVGGGGVALFFEERGRDKNFCLFVFLATFPTFFAPLKYNFVRFLEYPIQG